MNRIIPILIAVVIAIGGAFYMTQNNGSLPGVSVAEAQSSDAAVEPAADMILGDKDAPITVIEYASFTCPHCANFHEDTFKKLKQNYIDTGKIQFIHREVYFDQFGLWAGMIARCGGDTRYFGLIDLIYGGQKDWIADGSPSTIVANLKKLGRTAGMTDEQLDACLQDEASAQSLVAAYQQNAGADEITGTPSFIIDGTKYSNMNYSDFAAILDEKLGE
ncbi:Protein-disulfide isomerase [Aliiroseovarius halocynthiae]|uniref:DsbA family protein n=1 Tax=Aliiroseovarius halocynthiae TaxID=985055 RepID=A0A545SNT9_9RHOB|nr:DsbA family protein [Aliiroseovarius halocynthiae]TQV66658.1 DsbA family protein [Aliiroseovarius halocynthiae]SMR82465.1 Protein-disulfide isomerase [Aliiroseovarius halocynthiae]